MSNFDLPKKISILGATGSIGQNTLDVLAHHGGAKNFDITALTLKLLFIKLKMPH